MLTEEKSSGQNLCQLSSLSSVSSSNTEHLIIALSKEENRKPGKKSIDPPGPLLQAKMTPGQQICYVVRKMHRVGEMQKAVNALYGPFLAISIGFTVIILVILKYLLIRNMSTHMSSVRQDYLDTNGANLVSPELNETLAISAGSNNLYVESPHGWYFFLGFDICFSIRLMALTRILAKVHSASINFNLALSKVLLKAQKLTSLKAWNEAKKRDNSFHEYMKAAEHLCCQNCGLEKLGRSETRAREIVTPIEADSVLAFVTSNSSHPIAFSAGGLFTFSGNTILLINSIIISYLVFLLQA